MSGISSDSPVAAAEPPIRFRFRIVHLVYVTALFASAFAVLGPFGGLAATIVALFWAAVFANTARARLILGASVAGLAVACMPLLEPPRDAGPGYQRINCSNNLRQIALALHSYHDTWGAFLPAYIADKDGRPMHSWRVLILPFLDEQRLYERYDFHEPWNGPNNSKLLSEMPHVYRCSSDRETSHDSEQCTSYIAVVTVADEEATGGGGRIGDLTGVACNPIMLIEDSEARTAWTEPIDWSVDEALGHLSSEESIDQGPHREEDFFFEYPGGRNAALADASVHYYYDNMGRDNWTHLLTFDGSEAPSGPEGIPESADRRAMKVANWLRLAAFVVLSFWPVPWAWREPRVAGEPNRSLRTEPTA